MIKKPLLKVLQLGLVWDNIFGGLWWHSQVQAWKTAFDDWLIIASGIILLRELDSQLFIIGSSSPERFVPELLKELFELQKILPKKYYTALLLKFLATDPLMLLLLEFLFFYTEDKLVLCKKNAWIKTLIQWWMC